MECRNAHRVPDWLGAYASELYCSPECQVDELERPQVLDVGDAWPYVDFPVLSLAVDFPADAVP